MTNHRIQAEHVQCPTCHDVVATVDLTPVLAHEGRCPVCNDLFEGSRRKRYCGRKCQLAAYREKRNAARDVERERGRPLGHRWVPDGDDGAPVCLYCDCRAGGRHDQFPCEGRS